jgi:hypothetical protein
MMIRFPSSLQMDGEPFLQVMQGKELDLLETQRLAGYVDYSPLLDTVTFFARDPVPDRAYRICWRLASPRLVKESQTPPEDMDLHQAMVRTLLWLRGLHEVAQQTQEEREALDRLRGLLGECAGLIQKSVDAPIAVANLEVSLMVVDDQDEDRASTLRLVAGSVLGPAYWTMTMAAGDGNAGRAVKSMAIRVFDSDKAAKEPFKHVYKRIEGSRPHRWLMSIPLFSCPTKVFAVLNIGTFEKAPVRVLQKLEGKDEFVDNLQRMVVSGIRMEATRGETAANVRKS